MTRSVFLFALSMQLLSARPVGAGTPHDPYIYWLPSGRTGPSSSFTVKLRETRMGIPDADLVLVRNAIGKAALPALAVTVGGKGLAEPWRGPYLVIPAAEFNGKSEIPIILSAPTACRFYLTRDFRDLSAAQKKEYDPILRAEFARDWRRMLALSERASQASPDSALGRLARMKARYARYQLKSAEKGLSARARYLLG
ncbi:MAG: hypothetical protein ACPL7K_10250, partial [Armatimonadota bacterium]